MARITDRQALALWELGASRHPLDRSLLLLAGLEGAPVPADGTALADVDVQRRDHALLQALADTVGPTLHLHGPCAACGEMLEFTISTVDVLAVIPDASREVEVEGWHVRFRLPTSTDMAAALRDDRTDDPADGRAVAHPCLVEVRPPDGHAADPLPHHVEVAVEEAMAAAAPHADVVLAATCEDCGATSDLAFDPGAALWSEVATRGRVLVDEVVTLAWAFGWSEDEVLALGPRRRRTYLDAVG